MMSALVIDAVLWGIVLGMGETQRAGIISLVMLVILALGAFFGFLVGQSHRLKLKRRIASMGQGFEEESLKKAGKGLYYGEHWLVYTHNDDWLVWTREHVKRIVISQRSGLGTRATLSVYADNTPFGEAISFSQTNLDTLRDLEVWPHA